MQRYKCRSCAFTFSEADRSWDSAIDSGRCPQCSEPLYDFPVPVRGHKAKSAEPLPPPATHRPTPSAQPSPSVSAARFCSSCGAPVVPGSNFCAQCGATLPTSRSAEPVSSKAADNSQNSNIVSPSVETKPYPWGSVLKWVGVGLLAGSAVVHAPYGSSFANAMGLKIVGGIGLGVLLGFVVGVYKFLKRKTR